MFMQTSIARVAGVACLLVGGSVWAQGPAPAAPDSAASAPGPATAASGPVVTASAPHRVMRAKRPPPPSAVNPLENSAAFQAYMAALAELAPLMQNRDESARLDQIAQFEFSAATRQKIAPYFANNPRPLHLTVNKSAPGRAQVDVALDGLDYLDASTGAYARSANLTAQSLYSRGYTQSHTTGSMAWLSVNDGEGTRVGARDLSFQSDTHKGSTSLWVGKAQAKLQSVTVDSAAGTHLQMGPFAMTAETKEAGRWMQLDWDSRVESIDWGTDHTGPVHWVMRASHLESQAVARYAETAQQLALIEPSLAKRMSASLAAMKELSQSLRHNGATLDLQDLSVQYHGASAGLSGRVTLDAQKDADSSDWESLKSALHIHFKLHVPVRLIALLAKGFGSAPEAAAQAQQRVDQTLAKLKQDKWIRIDHDTVLTTLDFEKGQLTVNGKLFELPKL